jgi:putative transcriptional regulator
MMEKLRMMISGEITISPNPGKTMRKWREIFQITQAEVAGFLKITPSTVSDYEGERRKSPGIRTISRFVDALFKIDAMRGGHITKKLLEPERDEKQYFEAIDFSQEISLEEFVKIIEGTVITNEDIVKKTKIYGYTLIDSLNVILDMPYSYFPRLYGGITERAFIFLGVSTGRSPLVVIRMEPSKPKAVVLHNLEKVDELAIKISERERIPIITTKMSIEEIKKRLNI